MKLEWTISRYPQSLTYSASCGPLRFSIRPAYASRLWELRIRVVQTKGLPQWKFSKSKRGVQRMAQRIVDSIKEAE